MAIFRVGQMVKLVSHDPDDYLPPVGAIGTVLRGADQYGEYSVLFHGHPCPVESTDWEVHGCQLAPLTNAPEGRKRVTYADLVDAAMHYLSKPLPR